METKLIKIYIIWYQYINVRRDWSGKGVIWEGGSDETTLCSEKKHPLTFSFISP